MVQTGLDLLDALQYLRYLRRKKAATVCPALRRHLTEEIREVRDEIARMFGFAGGDEGERQILKAFARLAAATDAKPTR